MRNSTPILTDRLISVICVKDVSVFFFSGVNLLNMEVNMEISGHKFKCVFTYRKLCVQ